MKQTFVWGSFQANTFLYQARADSFAIKHEPLVTTSNPIQCKLVKTLQRY